MGIFPSLVQCLGRGSIPMRDLILNFLRDKSAATAIEYSLIAAGIALAIVATVNGIGTVVQTPFATVQTALK
jgi:pilus assembly protein Flp/PilA